MLADAHVGFEEYKIANYYYDLYLKQFGSTENTEFVRFLKIKSNYYSYRRAGRDQNMLMDAIAMCDDFIQKYPDSAYLLETKTMKLKLKTALAHLNNQSSELYAKLDKNEASKYYTDKNSHLGVDTIRFDKPIIPWYRWLFE